jgi:hypothetical protein
MFVKYVRFGRNVPRTTICLKNFRPYVHKYIFMRFVRFVRSEGQRFVRNVGQRFVRNVGQRFVRNVGRTHI